MFHLSTNVRGCTAIETACADLEELKLVQGPLVLLDLYDTLAWLDGAALREARNAIARELGVAEDTLQRGYQLTFDERTLGRFGDGRGDVAAIVVWLGLHSDPDLVAHIFKAEVAGWRAAAHLYEDVEDGLRRLRADGVRLALLSNCSFQARAIIEGWGLERMVDDVILSCEVGCAKPDAAIFHLALDRLRGSAESSIFVDDQPGHLDAAAAIGLQTRWMCRAANVDAAAGSRHRSIRSLHELDVR